MSSAPNSAAFLRRRAERRQRDLTERMIAARRSLEDIAPVLRDRYGAQRVVLFGSLARGALHERSDIDLAVWGLDRRHETAAADLVVMAVQLPVDLVRMEDAPPRLRARVEADGVDIVSGG